MLSGASTACAAPAGAAAVDRLGSVNPARLALATRAAELKGNPGF
jgi:hypothetical protein